MKEFEMALSKMIQEHENKLSKAQERDDWETCIKARSFLNALQVVSTMYYIAKQKENKK